MSKEPTLEFRLQNGMLEYGEPGADPIWESGLDRIVLLAEFTTAEGMPGDRHLLVFWTFENDELHRAQANFESSGRDEMVRQLSAYWNVELKVGLTDSAEWQSRVIWPRSLADRPYFTLEELPPSGLRQKIRRGLFGPVLQYFPTEEVSNYLRRFNPDF